MSRDKLKKEFSISLGLQQLPEGPVYLVSSEFEGKKNIMSVSMFAYMSGKLVSVGIAPSRFSFGLIRNSHEYVINVVDQSLIRAVKICGENSGRDVDKFSLTKLTPMKGVKVNAPTIQESPVSLECTVVKEVDIGGHVWFIAEVQAAQAREGYDWRSGLLLKWIGEKRFYFKLGKKVGKF
ncbi:flavin reductase family protein [Candidatus Bathyarchaeota archaeon]|nr:flavin reductase family protein [Candidatus Bathyarchaeota archaeon]